MLNIQNHYIIVKSDKGTFAILDTINNDLIVGLFNSFEGAFSYWLKELKAD